MKRICMLLLLFILLLCVGCVQKGHIVRNNIEIDDFAFLFDDCGYERGQTSILDVYEGFRRETIKSKDILDALGLPNKTTIYKDMEEYTYLVGDQYDIVIIKYSKYQDQMIDFDPLFDVSEEYGTELLATGKKTIDRNKYEKNKRFDITEEELSFISENTDSNGLQQVLGAPHSFIEAYDVNIKGLYTNVFEYGLKNKKAFKVAYFRHGYILRAWVEDCEGNEIKLFIDRGRTSFYKEE